MNYYFRTCIAMLLLLCFFTSITHAQRSREAQSEWYILMNDGNEFTGTLVSKTDESVTINTKALGRITIALSDIKSMKTLDEKDFKNGQMVVENKEYTRYLWSPSSYSLKKGEGYYQNAWVLFNQVAYGVTDHFSMGVGLLPLFLFGEDAASPIWLSPKLTLPIKNETINLGVGALIGTVIEGDSGGFGMAYGSATFGSRDNNMSFGVGYGYADGEWADVPLLTLSGMFRTGRKSHIITENYFLDVGDEIFGLLSLGARIDFKNISLDYGGFVPVGSDVDGLSIIPWLGISIPFGRN